MARERTQQRKRPGGPAGQVKRRNCFFCKEKIDDAVMRHLAVKHIEGSRTSTPRDETPAPAPVAVPQYEAPPTETDEEE